MPGIPGPFRDDFVKYASMTHEVRLEIGNISSPTPQTPQRSEI